jgi:NAD-dependent SIR2 family protein deacetylase
MPVYNFECTNQECLHQFSDLFYSWKDLEKDGPPKCPKCKSETIKIECCIEGETLNVLYKGLPFGNGSTMSPGNLRSRYPKCR